MSPPLPRPHLELEAISGVEGARLRPLPSVDEVQKVQEVLTGVLLTGSAELGVAPPHQAL